MSSYTTRVRFICESYAGMLDSGDLDSVDTAIAGSWEKIFNGGFHIFDEEYRAVLCKKILRHYYTREICAETVGLWKLWLNNKMNEIMPYYNKMYELESKKIEPLVDVDITTTHSGSGTNAGTSQDDFKHNSGSAIKSETTNSNKTEHGGGTRDVHGYADTPMGQLQDVQNFAYLSGAENSIHSSNEFQLDTGRNENTVTNKTNTTSVRKDDFNSTDEYVNKVTGKSAGMSYGRLIKEYRSSLVNIDNMIIEELKDLFFTLY